MRTRIAALIGLLLAPFLVLTAAGTSQATGACPNGWYPQRTYNYDGAAVAVLCFDNEGAGDRARLESLGRYRGVDKYMSIKACTLTSGGAPSSNCHQDAGHFQYYAGPITKWSCAWFHSIMYDGSGTKIVDRTLTLCG